jgi:Predicted ABC-type transport system involved in lysophospholipase L1 biosynthesis, permease component
MNIVQLGLWLLRRERRHGEWRVLLAALAIGVGSVATTGMLGQRLALALHDRGANLLGADLVLSSPRPVPDLPATTLRSSRALEFSSMLGHGDAFQLASVRAVDAAYPLKGTTRIGDAATPRAQPPRGSLYVEPALLPLLHARVGDTLSLGDAQLRIAGVIAAEPGNLGALLGLAPGVLMNADDVAATQVLRPGSRVKYLYQFAGDATALAQLRRSVTPRLDSTQRLIGPGDGVASLRGAFENADHYIQLTGLVSLLLAVVAIAIAAHRHALRHYDQAALLRCMGAGSRALRLLYGAQLALIGIVGSVLGTALGAALQYLLAAMLLPADTARPIIPGWTPLVVAIASGLAALAAASLPALLRLIRVSPLRVLRRELPPLPASAWFGASVSAALLLALTFWYAHDAKLVLLFVAALAALALVLALLAQLALLLGRGVQTMAHGPLRFGLAQLLRHRLDSTLQLGAFTLALFLLGLLALVRSDLIDNWRQQLPPDAPNYFLVNIAPAQTAAVDAYFRAQQLHPSALYPMVRGRLTGKNGVAIESTLPPDKRRANSLRRELNLTWSATLAANNRILAGHWHGSARSDDISVEAGMAKELDLALGDVLTFAIGDQTVSARIGSIRSVQWQSMQPNFFVIFAPGKLDALPANYIASVFVPPGKTAVMPGFVEHFPGVTVIALGALIANLAAIIGQVVGAIQLLLGFLLAAGIAVVFATLLASLDARQYEFVLLRTLGAERRFLTLGLAAEFVALGVLAGLLASVCAELAMAAIAERLLDLPAQIHPWLWLALPCAGAILIGTSGWLTTRRIARVPPMQSLRALS